VELIGAMSILKKHIWMFTYSEGVGEKAVDIYRMCELGERLVYSSTSHPLCRDGYNGEK